MALDSPEAYGRLGEHLRRVDSIFQAFLESTGYTDNTGALGRYPHRSATMITDVSRKIDVFGSAVQVPEPSAVVLLAFAGATALRRRRAH
ncbi:PEP-CTERM sorting domain-containing protein [Haloferula rosea]|uniref:PEP-CTERM sorting domain-containing protein n=1 Tax=Haloferula rosea TaxID=490093 RepID=A0A934RAM9_9BACT|nr:PEP-CTERM sorting domain-containing protein [Haloferula rosea]